METESVKTENVTERDTVEEAKPEGPVEGNFVDFDELEAATTQVSRDQEILAVKAAQEGKEVESVEDLKEAKEEDPTEESTEVKEAVEKLVDAANDKSDNVKVIKVSSGDKPVELRSDTTFAVKVNGKNQEVPLSDLLDRDWETLITFTLSDLLLAASTSFSAASLTSAA